VDFDLGNNPQDACVLEQRFGLDLSQYAGLSFCAKTTDRPRKFYVELLRVDNPLRPRATEVYRKEIEVPTTWQQFVIPFADLRLVSGGPKIKERTAFAGCLTLRRSVADFHCPGDSGKVWFDALRWLKPGEKVAPVGQQTVKQAKAQ
jgi:hypothetical protein